MRLFSDDDFYNSIQQMIENIFFNSPLLDEERDELFNSPGFIKLQIIAGVGALLLIILYSR